MTSVLIFNENHKGRVNNKLINIHIGLYRRSKSKDCILSEDWLNIYL